MLYELIGPACAKLSLYLSKSYSNKLEDIVEIAEDGHQKSKVELLIERIQAIQKDLPKHDKPLLRGGAGVLRGPQTSRSSTCLRA